MVLRSDLTDWENGNISCLTYDGLVQIASYYETIVNFGSEQANDLIEEDMEEEDVEEEVDECTEPYLPWDDLD